MDALNMMDAEDMTMALDRLTDAEKVYFKMLVSHVVRGFSDPDYSCVLVVGLNALSRVVVCSVNATEEHSAAILSHACDVLSFADTVGIPAKGEFH